MLQAVQLSKRYPEGPLALDCLNLSVKEGEIYCLMGPNGSGKTTLIHLFLGFLQPTAGSCFVNGIEVRKEPLEAKRELAYVPENVALYSNLTAVQNVRYFARLGGGRAVGKEDCEAALAAIGLPEDAFYRSVGKLSKGMRQKLGLAIAILRDARVILLDEPTSGLSPEAASALLSDLVRLKGRGKTLLMSTHDVFRVQEVADRVGILNQGKLLTEFRCRDLSGRELLEVYLRCMARGMSDSGFVESRSGHE